MTYFVIKVHEVRDDLDIRVVNASLADDFLQHIPQTRRENEDRHVVLVQAIKELLISFSATKQAISLSCCLTK